MRTYDAPFTAEELARIAELAQQATPNLYQIQRIMEPKQASSLDAHALHSKAFDYRNRVNDSIHADTVRDLGRSIADWATRSLDALAPTQSREVVF